MRHVTLYLTAAVALSSCLAAPPGGPSTLHHDEAVHGDLSGDPSTHAFELVAGVNEWRGAIEPTPSSQHDRWTARLPAGHQITEVTFSRDPAGGDGSAIRFLFGDFTQDFVDESGEGASFAPPTPSVTPADYGVQIITDFNIVSRPWTLTITVEGPGAPPEPT